MTNLDRILKSRDITLPTKVRIVKTMVFPSSSVQVWELDHKEGWVLKNWCFWIAVLEKTLESPLDLKEIKPVNPKGNQSWIFIGRSDAEAEAPIFWPPDAKSWLTGKDPDVGKDWGQEEKGETEDEMIGWHYWHNRHEFEQIPGDREGQGSQVCRSPWGRKQQDTTKRLNNLLTISDNLFTAVLLKIVKYRKKNNCPSTNYAAFIHGVLCGSKEWRRSQYTALEWAPGYVDEGKVRCQPGYIKGHPFCKKGE